MRGVPVSAPELVNAAVVLIDGRSGSGKTTLADELVQLLRSQGRSAEVLRVEDLYPGWDGLAAGSRAVAAALVDGGYRRYDWELGEFAEWVSLETVSPLIVEGCGAVTRDNLDAAAAWAERAGGGIVCSVWIDVPAELRRSRALARDGEVYAPHWKRWAAQEEVFFAYTRPEMLVDFVIELF